MHIDWDRREHAQLVVLQLLANTHPGHAHALHAPGEAGNWLLLCFQGQPSRPSTRLALERATRMKVGPYAGRQLRSKGGASSSAAATATVAGPQKWTLGAAERDYARRQQKRWQPVPRRCSRAPRSKWTGKPKVSALSSWHRPHRHHASQGRQAGWVPLLPSQRAHADAACPLQLDKLTQVDSRDPFQAGQRS